MWRGRSGFTGGRDIPADYLGHPPNEELNPLTRDQLIAQIKAVESLVEERDRLLFTGKTGGVPFLLQGGVEK